MTPHDNQYIYGLRAVIEALEAARDIDKILLKRDMNGESVQQLLALAREHQVPVQRVPVQRIERVTRKNHQGVVALMAAVTYYKLEQVLPMIYDNGDNPFFVILDGVTDVRNFGAIARTCECAGVSAIVIPETGSVSVNGDAVKTSAGALNYLPVCRERNIVEAVRYLRDSGVTIVSTSDKNAVTYTSANLTGPVAIVLGAEDRGISPEVMRLCDVRCTIPEFGNIHSLNVSVAAGIMIYEVVRQRLADNQQIQ
ncbi:MAG: 23S rRNA (guanosine(2251)-2'-O)-methyltransferase RlmB [Muribaculaceae bacterium]|nr:23S rRNA (guanosine(2251)-2'-O)-methyltransferase RlmB [Muribaculaceae bacterium]